MNIKLNYFDKFYVCRKCGNPNIKIFTTKIGGSNSCYECPTCNIGACNPQKMLKLKENINPEEIINIRNELIGDPTKGMTTLSPHLSRIVEMGNTIIEGKPPIIKNVTKLVYKKGILIQRNNKKV